LHPLSLSLFLSLPLSAAPSNQTIKQDSCEKATINGADSTSAGDLLHRMRCIATDCVVRFARHVPSFESIDSIDQNRLVQNAIGEFTSILLSYYNSVDGSEFVFGSLRFRRQDLDATSQDWLSQLTRLMPRLEPMYSDSSSIACLLSIVLLTNRGGLQRPEEVEGRQARLIDTFRDHITYDSHAQQLDLQLPKVLGLLSTLRSMSCVFASQSYH
jgi:hypothetical protein